MPRLVAHTSLRVDIYVMLYFDPRFFVLASCRPCCRLFTNPYCVILGNLFDYPLKKFLSNSQVMKKIQYNLVLVYPVNLCVCVCCAARIAQINYTKITKSKFRSRCYIVTRCTNLVSVHYFLPLGI